jgi:hypothetical protein
MITEFTCGICSALWASQDKKWVLSVNGTPIGIIHVSGECIRYTTDKFISTEAHIEIAVLMNNIKRQYNQLQTTS